jgi:sodium/proline symporter
MVGGPTLWSSYSDFVSAGKSLGGWVAAISSAASSESAWVMLAVSGLGYARGLAAYWTTIGCVLGFAATSLLVVVQLRRSSDAVEVLTLGDYLEQATADPTRSVRVVSALVISFFMLIYVVAQFIGTGKQMVGMELMDYRRGVQIGAIIIGIYVLLGGYAAVCWTDALQGLMMALVMVVFPVLAIAKVGGLAPLFELARRQEMSFWAGGQGLTWAAAGYALGRLGIGIGYPGMPHAIIRFVTVRDDHSARKAAVIGLVWGVLVLTGSATLGIAGRVLIPSGLADPEHILPAFTAAYFNPVIGGIILATVTAAIMSTADSQLMMAATALINDIWYPLRGKRAAETGNGRILVWKTRGLIALLTLVALWVALGEPRVIDEIVLFAWGALGSAFTPVILLALHWKRLNWLGALASFIVGPATVVTWKLIPGLSSAVYELFPAATLATLAALIVSHATEHDRPGPRTMA